MITGLVEYADPRILGLVSHYKWRDAQRDLLEGRKSWDEETWTIDDKEAYAWMHGCLKERGIRLGVRIEVSYGTRKVTGVVSTTVPLPPFDPELDAKVDGWDLRSLPVRIVSLDHVEDCERVPILKAVVYGSTGGIVGTEPAKQGLQETFIVGRLDVRQVCFSQRYHVDTDGALQWEAKREQGVHVVSPRGHMRQTLKRARNTARKISSAIPDWESFCAEREATEAKERLAAEQAAADLELEPFRAQLDADVDAGVFDDLL